VHRRTNDIREQFPQRAQSSPIINVGRVETDLPVDDCLRTGGDANDPNSEQTIMSMPIPGPRGSFILGSLKEFRAGLLPFLDRCHKEFGSVATFRLGPHRLVLLSEPSLIEEVLVHQNKLFMKHYAVRLLRPVLGNGLLLSEGKQWLTQRRLIQPAFSRRFNDDLAKIVRRHAERLAADWKESPRRDLYHDMTKLTVQIAAEAFLGVSDLVDMEEIGQHLEVIHADYEHRFQQAFTPPMWVPTSWNLRLRRAVQGLTALIDRMIERRKKDPAVHHDALSLLLRVTDEQGQGMPIQLLRDEVMTLLLAGHDTTSNSLTWTWVLLAQHPQVFEALRAEVRARDDGTQCTGEFPYTLKVIKESMRLLPPVYLFGRAALSPVQLGAYTIRKGDSVIMSQWVLHRDPRWYPDPLTFKPDRWTPEFESTLPKYAYCPFGGGPRVCLGKEVAMVEAATVLATLAREFDIHLESPETITPWPTVTLRPKEAVWAKVASRERPVVTADGGSSSE
jgi:cytochrome P450